MTRAKPRKSRRRLNSREPSILLLCCLCREAGYVENLEISYVLEGKRERETRERSLSLSEEAKKNGIPQNGKPTSLNEQSEERDKPVLCQKYQL